MCVCVHMSHKVVQREGGGCSAAGMCHIITGQTIDKEPAARTFHARGCTQLPSHYSSVPLHPPPLLSLFLPSLPPLTFTSLSVCLLNFLVSLLMAIMSLGGRYQLASAGEKSRRERLWGPVGRPDRLSLLQPHVVGAEGSQMG